MGKHPSLRRRDYLFLKEMISQKFSFLLTNKRFTYDIVSKKSHATVLQNSEV